MKKFLCVLLAVCALCGAAAFTGCKKDKGGKGSSGWSSGDNINEAPGEWEGEWNI